MNKGLVRLALRKYRRQNKIDRKLFRTVMQDDDMIEAVVAESEILYSASEGYRDWQSFFQWLLDNSDAIVAFIKLLIELFSDEAEI